MAARLHLRKHDGSLLLMEHCLVLGGDSCRPSALDRLEEALGSDLTRRLVFALTREPEPTAV
jgi:hypothetical protein